jgi:hypothetical protein
MRKRSSYILDNLILGTALTSILALIFAGLFSIGLLLRYLATSGVLWMQAAAGVLAFTMIVVFMAFLLSDGDETL